MSSIRYLIYSGLIYCLCAGIFTPGRSEAALESKSTLLSSGKLDMRFDVADSKLVLRGLKSPDGDNWISGDGSTLFWDFLLQGPEGKSVELKSNAISLSHYTIELDKGEFAWKPSVEDTTANVMMMIRLPEGDNISHWSLYIDLPKGWKVVRADFPLLPDISIPGGLKMATPSGWGLEYDVKPGVGFDGTYPSCSAAMQFLAFYTSGKGLYIGAHDIKGNHKNFTVNTRGNAVSYKCTNWPSIPKESGGRYEVPHEAAIGVFTGDYYDAAQIYRDFTFKTAWGKGGAVSKRHIPKWLKETELWLMPGSEPTENVESCKRAVKYFDVPIALHWYNWHQIPFDTLYPDYFPYKPQFPEGVDALQNLGLRVMPYINGRLADANSRTWKERDLEKSAAKQEDGSLYTEIYGSGVPLHPICPSTKPWQDTVNELVSRLTGECGVDGVYIDQIGAAGAVRCFDLSHNHLQGGGSMWVDSYREMLRDIRKKLPKDRILTTEENAECWIDQLDALLLVNTPTSNARIIPLFPSVYSGRTITFGFQYMLGDDYKKSFPFRAKMARAFVWGSQLGWIGVDSVLTPESTDADFLRNMARCRRFGHQYLVNGRFLGMLDVDGVKDHVKGEVSASFGTEMYRLDLPGVLVSSWEAEDGSLGIVMANMTDKEQHPRIRLPFDRMKMDSSGNFMMKSYGPEGLISSTVSSGSMQEFTLPARGALIISIWRK